MTCTYEPCPLDMECGDWGCNLIHSDQWDASDDSAWNIKSITTSVEKDITTIEDTCVTTPAEKKINLLGAKKRSVTGNPKYYVDLDKTNQKENFWPPALLKYEESDAE